MSLKRRIAALEGGGGGGPPDIQPWGLSALLAMKPEPSAGASKWRGPMSEQEKRRVLKELRQQGGFASLLRYEDIFKP